MASGDGPHRARFEDYKRASQRLIRLQAEMAALAGLPDTQSRRDAMSANMIATRQAEREVAAAYQDYLPPYPDA